MLKSMHLCNYLQCIHLYSFGGGKIILTKKNRFFFSKIFFSFSMHSFTVLSLLYTCLYMRLNEVSKIHIYKLNVYNILKIWDSKLICKTSVWFISIYFKSPFYLAKLKYVVTLRKLMYFKSYWNKNLIKLSFYFQIQVHGCTGKLSFSKMGVRNETYLQLKSLGTSRNGTVRILTHQDKYSIYFNLWSSAWKVIF